MIGNDKKMQSTDIKEIEIEILLRHHLWLDSIKIDVLSISQKF